MYRAGDEPNGVRVARLSGRQVSEVDAGAFGTPDNLDPCNVAVPDECDETRLRKSWADVSHTAIGVVRRCRARAISHVIARAAGADPVADPLGCGGRHQAKCERGGACGSGEDGSHGSLLALRSDGASGQLSRGRSGRLSCRIRWSRRRPRQPTHRPGR